MWFEITGNDVVKVVSVVGVVSLATVVGVEGVDSEVGMVIENQ